MKTLSNLISILQSKEIVNADYDVLEQIYNGRGRKRPTKVMNPDPNIDYTGQILEIVDGNNNYIFYHVNEKDINKTTGKITSIHIGFDVRDTYSPLENKRKTGRFSFQYEDISMPKGKPNYRRVLFFYADDTKPKPIKDYFANGNKQDFKEKGFSILSQLNENNNPSGLAYIFDYKNGKYYFANFNDGELEGLAFVFTSSGRSYVFEDAFIFHKGKKTNLYSSTINDIKKAKENGEQTVISWS